MAQAGRIIHTTGGRYKEAYAVEDAPLGEFISLRATGLQFHVVHPIPASYLADLNKSDRAGVHAHIRSSLNRGQYEGGRFVKAAKESLATLTKIMHEHDEIDSDETTTTDTSTTANSTPAATKKAQHNMPGSFRVEELTINMNGMIVEPVGSQTPPHRPRRTSDTSNWLNGVPAGESPPSVKAPSIYHTCTVGDDDTPAPSPTRGPRRHLRFTEDPALPKDQARQAIERNAAEMEFRYQKKQLDEIESLSAACLAPALCRSLSLAIRAARLAVAETQRGVEVSQAALVNVREKTSKALSIAEDVATQQAHQAPLRNSPLRESTQQISPVSVSQQSSASEPQQLEEASQQLQGPDCSSKRTEDALLDMDVDLDCLEASLGNYLKRTYLRERVLDSINKARDCINPVRLLDPHERLGYVYGQFDPRLVQGIGQTVLRTALVEQEEAKRILYATMAEEIKLDRVNRESDAAADRQRETEEKNRRRHQEDRARAKQEERQQDHRRERRRENQARRERKHSKRSKTPSFFEALSLLVFPEKKRKH